MGVSGLLTLQCSVVIYKIHSEECDGVAKKNNCMGFKSTYNVVDSIRSYPGVWPMNHKLDIPRLVFCSIFKWYLI